MKKVLIGIGLILALTAIGFAQKNKMSPEPADAPSPPKTKDKRTQGLSLTSATNIEAQLQSALDVKKSQVGDEVVLKTTKSIKQNGEVIVPKGTNLIGRITEVQQKSKDNAMSRIGMVFDRVEGKNLTAPITASIVSVSNVRAVSSVGDTVGSDMSGSSSSSAGTSGSSSGGGLLGGVSNTVAGVTNTVGGVTNTVRGVANTAGQTLGNTTGTLGRTVNGIQISQSASGSAQSSTTLSSPNKNLRLDKGATFQMQLNNPQP